MKDSDNVLDELVNKYVQEIDLGVVLKVQSVVHLEAIPPHELKRKPLECLRCKIQNDEECSCLDYISPKDILNYRSFDRVKKIIIFKRYKEQMLRYYKDGFRVTECHAEINSFCGDSDGNQGGIIFTMLEKTGHIIAYDCLLLEKALEMVLGPFVYLLGLNMTFSVNVSGKTVTEGISYFKSMRKVPPNLRSRIVLEITETEEAYNVERFKKVAEDFGFKVAIDDYNKNPKGAELLWKLKPYMVKLEVVSGVGYQGKSSVCPELLKYLEKYPDTVIVFERIESEKDERAILEDFPHALIQGFLRATPIKKGSVYRFKNKLS